MKRWIHAAMNTSLEDLFYKEAGVNYLARIDELPSNAEKVTFLSELNRGDVVAAPYSIGSGYVLLKIKGNDRAEDSVGNGYNLIEQLNYNRVVAERRGNKTAVYKI